MLVVNVHEHDNPMAVVAAARAAGHEVTIRDEVMERLADEDWRAAVAAMEADTAWLAAMEDEVAGRASHHRPKGATNWTGDEAWAGGPDCLRCDRVWKRRLMDAGIDP